MSSQTPPNQNLSTNNRKSSDNFRHLKKRPITERTPPTEQPNNTESSPKSQQLGSSISQDFPVDHDHSSHDYSSASPRVKRNIEFGRLLRSGKFFDYEPSPIETPYHIDTSFASKEIKYNVLYGHLSRAVRDRAKDGKLSKAEFNNLVNEIQDQHSSEKSRRGNRVNEDQLKSLYESINEGLNNKTSNPPAPSDAA